MELPITFEGRHLATLVAANDEVRLAYSAAWQAAADHFPISLRMPVDGSTYKGDIVLPWLMNLLPEGDPLRAMTRVVGATADDVLGLIARTGTDLAGALSIGLDTPGGTPDYREITQAPKCGVYMPIAARTRAAWPRRLPAECVWPCRATQREKWFCRNLCIMLEKYFNGAEHRASLAVGCIESEMHSSVTRLVMNHGPHGRIGQED